MNERVYSIPPAAAPRAQCLCRQVSGTVPGVLPGRHGRFCVARSAHGEAENCAATPRTRAARANARNGRCFPPWVLASLPTTGCWVQRYQSSTCGWLDVSGGGILKGGELCALPSSSEPPLSALLPSTSWARKKSARLPGRDPAISAAAGGTSKAPQRGAKKAPPGAARQTQNRLPGRALAKTRCPASPERRCAATRVQRGLRPFGFP